jgi:hypothetical protein
LFLLLLKTDLILFCPSLDFSKNLNHKNKEGKEQTDNKPDINEFEIGCDRQRL